MMGAKHMRKIELMHVTFGKCHGKQCKNCFNYIRFRYHDRPLRKCRVYGITQSEASDWTGKWQACGAFDKDIQCSPIMELVRKSKIEVQYEPLEGQCAFEEV